jgi:predicted nucleic acid-binding protein
MSAWFLDTSALLAHFRQEVGSERTQEILEIADAEVFISAISVAELGRRIASLGESIPEARRITLEYAGLATKVLPVDTATAIRAFEIAAACEARLPLVDALIAAAAGLAGATLVHRDLHFNAIPAGLVTREELR